MLLREDIPMSERHTRMTFPKLWFSDISIVLADDILVVGFATMFNRFIKSHRN